LAVNRGVTGVGKIGQLAAFYKDTPDIPAAGAAEYFGFAKLFIVDWGTDGQGAEAA
jgi:hypothetical protein